MSPRTRATPKPKAEPKTAPVEVEEEGEQVTQGGTLHPDDTRNSEQEVEGE